MNYIELLLNNNYVSIPDSNKENLNNNEAVATIAMNIAYYGRSLSQEAFNKLKTLDANDLVNWWEALEVELKKITGAHLQMGKHIVYKNFPKEVLDKNEFEYWLPQILMYCGFPKELFTQEEVKRPKINEGKNPVVLHLAVDKDHNTLFKIISSIAKSPAKWNPFELAAIEQFWNCTSISEIPFKENMVSYANYLMSKNIDVSMPTATDVLRLACALSGGDPSLKEDVKFKSFSNQTRRMFINSLENSTNLVDDVAARKEIYKRFLYGLHASSYVHKYGRKKYPKLAATIDMLYNDKLESFNSKVEFLLKNKDVSVLDLLAERPGVFKRRLCQTINLFGEKAAKRFVKQDVLSKLTVYQLVSLKTFLEMKNVRDYRVFPPKGNWAKMQIVDNKFIDKDCVKLIVSNLSKEIKNRVPSVNYLDSDLMKVKLPSPGEISKYTRGTEIVIPEDVDFLRIASYWQSLNKSTVWFDNGVNFFDSNWNAVETIAWNLPKVGKDKYAVFSGDPVNSQTSDGKACQVIDIYLDKIPDHIRYGVWNILCYSRVKFSEVEEVFGCLQWGKDKLTGKVFEPSRSQIAFNIKGDVYSKYICVFDFFERKIIMLDVALKAHVNSAKANEQILTQNLPAFIEYVATLPSVYDLFMNSVDKDSNIKMLYSDKNTSLLDVEAYVFKPENDKNKFNQIDINKIIQ
jgi:hypothetical protein